MAWEGTVMVDLQGKSRAELEQIISDAQAALERMTVVWELRERHDWQVREFERLAAVQGPVPASPVPSGGFMPGAIVDTGGELYVNGSGAFIDYAPGDEPISEWVHVDEPPTPGEPEDPPAEPEPVVPEWDGNNHAYQTGDTVTYQDATYRARQPHTSQPGWTPTTIPALWEPVSTP